MIKSLIIMADRNEILLNFQACTQLENIEECIAVLESHDWNLVDAINSTVAHLQTDSCDPPLDIPPEPNIAVEGRNIAHDFDLPIWSPVVDAPYQPIPSSSFDVPGRFIDFTIEYRGRNIPVVLQDNETVGRIKAVLEEEIGVPAEQQVLKGWPNREADDKDTLRSLHLPKNVRLILMTPALSATGSPSDKPDDSNIMAERLTQNFTLIIIDKNSGREYSLVFRGTKTIQQVKSDVFHVTDIPVRNQVWKGWPNGATDDQMTLAVAGIGYPCHHLEISRSRDNRRFTAEAAAMEFELSDDDFEDAPEHFPMEEDIDFERDTSINKPKPLIPEKIVDECSAVEHFTAVFNQRYGECHPDFYIGKLDNAIKDALIVKAKEKRLLAVYLHNDNSILANIFCSQLLCKDSICSYLSQNFVMWPWDLTHESNRSRFLSSCTQHFGSMASTTVRNYKVNQMPLILVITRTRATNEVFTVIQGNVTIEELMASLIQAVDVFQEQQRAEIVEEDARDMREQVKQEQDTAYEESLATDRAKAESRKKEEERILKEEMDEQAKRHNEQMKQQEEEAVKEARRQSIAELLAPEPAPNCQESTCVIRVRVPDGNPLTRRFMVRSPLRQLMHYIVSQGFHLEEYKVLTTYPRRDLTTLDDNLSLQELKLYPQETVILEER